MESRMTMHLSEVISKLSYKPGWSFSYEHRTRATLVIHATVQHSKTLDTVRFDIRRVIPEIASGSAEAFLSWWEDMLIEAEIHEAREFARYDGQLVDDPHEVIAATA
jgi:hypothetical protein